MIINSQLIQKQYDFSFWEMKYQIVQIILIMLKQLENQQFQKVILNFRQLIKNQAKQLQQYQLAVQCYQRQKHQQKCTFKEYLKKINQLEIEIEYLKKQNNQIKLQLQSLKSYLNFYQIKYQNLAYNKGSLEKQKKMLSTSYQKMNLRNFFKQNKIIPLENRNNITQKLQSQYTIEPIKFKKQKKINQKLIQSRFKQTQKVDQKIIHKKPAQTIAQNFFVIGPDINQFYLFHQKKSQKQVQIVLKPAILYEFYKQNIEGSMIRQQILIRSFPKNVKLKKQVIQGYNYNMREIIEFQPNHQLSQDYFIINIRCQEQKVNKKQKKQVKHNQFLQNVNINQQVFIICLKISDFIITKPNHKKNQQSQLWITQKIYAVISHYPFFDTHIKFMAELQNIIYKHKLKILQQNIQKFLNINLDTNIKLFLRNQKINQYIHIYLNKSPIISGLCETIQPYGTIINQKDASYMQATYASGIVFSNISYQQFLLILTAILSEKIVIFISKCACISTFSAITFLGLIYPFKYPHAKILNADSSKFDTIFQSPFPLIASITINQKEMNKIIEKFVQANLDNQKSIHVIVDLDSNTILLDKGLRNDLQKMIPSPNQTLKNLYMQNNSCRAKSLFLTKQMQTITGVLTLNDKRNRTKQQQIEQKKKLLQKQYKQEIQQNKTKFVSWKSDFRLIQQLRNFISKFTITNIPKKFTKNEDPKEQIIKLKKKILQQNLEYRHFLNHFVTTQIFSLDLDNKIYY